MPKVSLSLIVLLQTGQRPWTYTSVTKPPLEKCVGHSSKKFGPLSENSLLPPVSQAGCGPGVTQIWFFWTLYN